MTSFYPATDHLADTTPVKCDDCKWSGTVTEVQEINDAGERLSAGSEIPAGECPECGALAYLLQRHNIPVKLPA